MFWFVLYIIFVLLLIHDKAVVNALLSSSTDASRKQLRPCPTTKWTTEATHRTDDEIPIPDPRPVPFLKSIKPPINISTTTDDEYEWLQQNSINLMEFLNDHGALIFKGFHLPRTKIGFRRFCEAFGSSGIEACEDSLASIGVRSLLSASDGVYRAVDSESLADTFIGLHNDCTFCLAPPYGAFACFEQAEEGGEFLLADGRDVLRAMDSNIIRKLGGRGLRVRVAGIPTQFLVCNSNNTNNDNVRDIAQSLKGFCSQLLKRIASWGVTTMFPRLRLEVRFSDDQGLLQILEPLKNPLNGHPRGGKLTFFSGIHSQSAYLQRKRAANAFSGVAITDVFYGEDDTMGRPIEPIETDVLDHIEEVVNRHTTKLLMKPGDVVLLDSYQVLHGRDTFQGPREHGVIWLTSNDFSSE